jgi:nucleoid-associated protein YgaU
MLHAFFRAATVTLLAVIAVLIYVNYFRSTETPDIVAEHEAIETPPELPKLAVEPDIPAALAEVVPLQTAAANPRSAQTRAEQFPNAARSGRGAREPIAEILDLEPIAEVVDLPSRKPAVIAAVALPAPAPKLSGKHTHVVLSGESLWVISRKYYGTGELYSKIAESNGLASKDRIRPGQVLIIPDANAPAATTPVPEEIADHEDVPRAVPVSMAREYIPPAVSANVKHRTKS